MFMAAFDMLRWLVPIPIFEPPISHMLEEPIDCELAPPALPFLLEILEGSTFSFLFAGPVLELPVVTPLVQIP